MKNFLFFTVDAYSNSGGSYLSRVVFYCAADLNIGKHILLILNVMVMKPLKRHHYMFSILMFCKAENKISASMLPLFQSTQMTIQVICTSFHTCTHHHGDSTVLYRNFTSAWY